MNMSEMEFMSQTEIAAIVVKTAYRRLVERHYEGESEEEKQQRIERIKKHRDEERGRLNVNEDTPKYNFMNTWEINIADLPKEMFVEKDVHSLVDGSSLTISENRITHNLTNGSKRIYEISSYSEYILHLIYEKLPDGQLRTYDWYGKVSYECDADGNYKKYGKRPFCGDGLYLCEEGNKDRILRSYYYDEYVTVMENTPKQEFVSCDWQGRVIKEGDAESYKAYYTNGAIKEVKEADGTIREYYLNGQIKKETLVNGPESIWNEQGQKISESMGYYGPKTEWNDAGQKIREITADRTEYQWYDDGTKKAEIKRDGSEIRWHQETGTIAYQRERDGTFHVYDTLSRVTEEGDTKHKTTYEYYGDTKRKQSVRVFADNKEVSYSHYTYEGINDTDDKHIAMRAVAEERIAKEDKLGHRLPKMNKVAKSIAMYKAIQKVKKGK